jgi:hypothetical protein
LHVNKPALSDTHGPVGSGVAVDHLQSPHLADRYSTRTIATLDRRHFGTLRPLHGGRFSLVP